MNVPREGLMKQRATEPPGPASWSDDPNCKVCARVVSARELRERGLERCPFCGGELVWPLGEAAERRDSEREPDR
jgi:hypothetical protein